MTLVAEGPYATGATVVGPAPEPYLAGLTSAEEFLAPPVHDRRSVTIEAFASDGSYQRPAWLEELERAVNALLALSQGWDGRRARPLTEEAVEAAIELSVGLMFQYGIPVPPQVFPLPDGGIQFEWHAGGQSVEVEVDADGSAHVLCTRQNGSVAVEGEISSDEPDSLLEAVSAFLVPLWDRIASQRGAPA